MLMVPLRSALPQYPGLFNDRKIWEA